VLDRPREPPSPAISAPHSHVKLCVHGRDTHMAAFILLGLQAAAALTDPAIPADFDLRALPVHEDPLDVTGSRDCRSNDGMEIVVCGRRSGEQRYRLRALPGGNSPVRAEMGAFGNSKVAVETESVPIGNPASIDSGMVSRRAMIRLKTRF
jgi:hypothetical protein